MRTPSFSWKFGWIFIDKHMNGLNKIRLFETRARHTIRCTRTIRMLFAPSDRLLGVLFFFLFGWKRFEPILMALQSFNGAPSSSRKIKRERAFVLTISFSLILEPTKTFVLLIPKFSVINLLDGGRCEIRSNLIFTYPKQGSIITCLLDFCF